MQSEILSPQGGEKAVFYANIADMTAFLSASIDALANSGHELTDSEKSGFSLCMDAVKQNIAGYLNVCAR